MGISFCKNLEFKQNDYDTDGITFNAYTDSDRIVFYLSGLNSKLVNYRDEFIKLIGKFNNITEADFQKERNIVLSEYNDYFNEHQHWLNFDRKYFNNYGPIGSREDLESLTFQDLKEFHKLQFSKPHYIVNATPNSPYSNLLEFSTEIITKDLSYDFDNNYIEEKVSIPSEVQKELIITSNIISNSRDIIIGKFFSKMLSFGLQSPLYTKIREEHGLVYYISTFISEKGNNAVFKLYTSTATSNTEKLLELLDEVINDDSYLTQERFDVVYNNTEVQRELDKINIYQNLEYFFKKKTALPLHYTAVTLEDVKEFHEKYIKDGKYKFITSFS